jgi:hypothetical protein
MLLDGDLGGFEICDAGSTDWNGHGCNSQNTVTHGPEGLKMCSAREAENS